jgi:hypothetical protein
LLNNQLRGELTMSNVLGGALEVFGLLKDLAEKIGSESGEQWLAEFKKFLRKEPTWGTTYRWPIWRTFLVGGKTKDQLISGVEQAGMKIGNWARDMMNQESFRVSPGAEEVNFVKVTPRDLGFTEMPTTDELYARAGTRGLDLCLADDAPAIRQQYKDQPDGEVIWFAMKQITGSGGRPGVFRLYRGGVWWLHGYCVDSGDRWHLDDGLVFRLRKLSS